MAKMPGVFWDPLPENQTEPLITPTQIILHTAVDAKGPTDLQAYFARRDVFVESHFWITRAGVIVQMMDTGRQADANYGANNSAISIETEDDGDPEGNPWTPEQVASIVKVVKWAATTHEIPLELCKSDTSPGVGWHSMWGFADPMNLTGPKTNPWTNAFGKTCPGKTRIHQIVDEVMPALNADPDADPAVVELQEFLMANGYDLPRWGADGKMGDETNGAVKLMFDDLEMSRKQAEILGDDKTRLSATIHEQDSEIDDLNNQLAGCRRDLKTVVNDRDAVAAARDQLKLQLDAFDGVNVADAQLGAEFRDLAKRAVGQ